MLRGPIIDLVKLALLVAPLLYGWWHYEQLCKGYARMRNVSWEAATNNPEHAEMRRYFMKDAGARAAVAAVICWGLWMLV